MHGAPFGIVPAPVYTCDLVCLFARIRRWYCWFVCNFFGAGHPSMPCTCFTLPPPFPVRRWPSKSSGQTVLEPSVHTPQAARASRLNPLSRPPPYCLLAGGRRDSSRRQIRAPARPNALKVPVAAPAGGASGRSGDNESGSLVILGNKQQPQGTNARAASGIGFGGGLQQAATVLGVAKTTAAR